VLLPVTRFLGDRDWPGPRALIGDVVFGANDGLITTFAVVSSVTGAELGAPVALVLGLANLLADGISMGAGDYLGRRSEAQARANHEGEEEPGRWVPAVHGAVIFGSFVAVGAVPLLPYLVLDSDEAFPLAAAFTVVTLFVVGAARTRVTGARWLTAGLEMLVIGSVAAVVAFAVGFGLRGVL
jgi:VIT1/CCC1 family predicted Fe2+/Mn2+ transporter